MGALAQAWIDRLARADDFAGVQGVIRSHVRDHLGFDGVTFVVRDGDDCFYVDEDAIAPLWKGQRFPIDECVTGWAMLHGQPAVVSDVFVDERVPEQAYRPTFVRSLVAVPVGEPDAVAAIGAYSADRGTPAPDVLARLQDLAAHVAAAVDRLGVHTAPFAPSLSRWRR